MKHPSVHNVSFHTWSENARLYKHTHMELKNPILRFQIYLGKHVFDEHKLQKFSD